jgi:hypothetical protein
MYYGHGGLGMNIRKIHLSAVIIAIIITVIATTTAFLNVTVLATPLLGQGGNTTTGTTTASLTGQQSTTIHITKDSTNSYVISGGSSSVGSFDTTYRIAGERSAIKTSENLVISTVTDDFKKSPTIGYIRAGNMTTTAAANTTTTLPNPFATPEVITERITNELRRVISEAENNTSQGQYVEINCGFGMTLEDMRCHYVPLLGAGQ